MTSSSRPRPHPHGEADLRDRLTYRALVATAQLTQPRFLADLWSIAWARTTRRMAGSTVIQMHGRKVTVNAGYAYPAFARRWPTYNHPLVELVQQVHIAHGRKIAMVDVGAAVGDTVLLVLDRCPDSVRSFHCVEADPEFFGYLQANLGGREGMHLHPEMLSDSDAAPSLVRTHSGTASPQGPDTQRAVTLDGLLGQSGPVDLLKIDTDGFDGKVLAGASAILRQQAPAVIFEWHPILLEATQQDLLRPFEVLLEAGYGWFVWFTKEGEFSHLDHGFDAEATTAIARLCLAGDGPRPDWHYDVVALPENAGEMAVDVARLRHARAPRR